MYFKSHLQSLSYSTFFPPRKLIYFVSGACGSGKTQHTCDHIKKWIHETNYIYVAPSNELAGQTAGDLRKRGLSNVVVVNSNTHPGNVRRQIIKKMKGAPEEGLVLIITWQAYIGLPYVPEKKNFQLVIDEIPQLNAFLPLRLLPRNVEQISEWVEIATFKNEQVGVSKARDLDKLQRYVEENDDVNGAVIAILRHVASANKNVYVDLKSWTRVIEKRKKGKTDEEKTVYFVALLRPNFLFDSIMLGANIENSLLYYYFSKQHGIRFAECKDISQRLTPVDTRSREIEVCYFLEGSYFSKYKSGKPVGDEGTVIEVMDKEAVKHVKNTRMGQQILFTPNRLRFSLIVEKSHQFGAES